MKIISVIVVLILLSSCSLLAPMQPNSYTVTNNTGPSPEQENSVASLYGSDTQGNPDTLEIDFYGLGNASIKVSSINIEESWEDADVTASDLSDENQYFKSSKILIVNFEFKNLSIKTELSGADEHLINNFYLVTKPQLDNPSQPLSMIEPVYYKQSSNTGKKYFRFNVPSIGEAASITFGFQLSSSKYELLQKNELFIAYTTMGLEDACVLPLTIDE